MAVAGNFYFSIFFRLTWEFLGLESEHGDSFCWPNNKIIDMKPIQPHRTTVMLVLEFSVLKMPRKLREWENDKIPFRALIRGTINQ